MAAVPPLPDALVVLATATNGLLAGVFFGFAIAVSPGFRRVDDAAYVRAFRAINRAILNGWFLTVFAAAPLSALACAAVSIWHADEVPRVWAGLAAACAVLTVLITAARSVPLNTVLDRAADRTGPELARARTRFEGPWNQWNLVRTLTSTVALASLAAAGTLG